MNYEPHPDHPLEIAYPFFPEEERAILHQDLDRILTDRLSMGSFTASFEREFAKFVGAQTGIAVPSCTAALEIALSAAGVQAGDEILVPAQTFVATGAAVHLVGARPVFTEVEEQSFSMDFDDALARITPRTRGAIVVHFGGVISADLPAFVAELRKRGLFVIEDDAHAHGAELHGQRAGSFADAGCFSFYPTKIMTTGEGGMITTSDPAIADRARSLQHRGRDMTNPVEIYGTIGRNNRFPEMAGAMGLSQLRSLPAFLEVRREVARIYDNMLGHAAKTGASFKPLLAPADSRPSYWRYTVFFDAPIDRPKLRSLLAEDRITIDWAYHPPVHLQPAFQQTYGTRPGMLPVAESLMARHVCLPIHARFRAQDAEYVAQRFIARVRELGCA